jgi:hypothetical protein
MTGFSRWSVVAALVLLVVVVPLAWRAVPVDDDRIGAADLLARIERSQDLAYSGYVESRGTLRLPVADRFTDLGGLLGGLTRMRVWWRSIDSWRVAELLAAGERDVVRDAALTTSWDYEENEAELGAEPDIRLPRAADLVPPMLARRLLDDVDRDGVSRIPARRVAGRNALGLRLTPGSPLSSIHHVDLWADRETGIPLRVEVYGARDARPVVASEFRSFDPTSPDRSTVTFTPPAGARSHFDDILDIADAANQYAPFVPPRTLAGLAKSPKADRAVGVYGSGLTRMIAIPLWSRAANPLREQMLLTPGVRRLDEGTLVRVGPLGVLLTWSRHGIGQGWLVSGTVIDDALLMAAHDLASGVHLAGGRLP